MPKFLIRKLLIFQTSILQIKNDGHQYNTGCAGGVTVLGAFNVLMNSNSDRVCFSYFMLKNDPPTMVQVTV